MITKEQIELYGMRKSRISAEGYADQLDQECGQKDYAEGFTDCLDLLFPLVELLQDYTDNHGLLNYEMIGGDGAPIGYVPYEAEWTWALKELNQIKDKIEGTK